ncbi:MAG: hypothetical protein HOP28_12905, partial [Gemmatimonadales bacterium]|nr:hypothetical protein [Gemmatimonadales bacterium]
MQSALVTTLLSALLIGPSAPSIPTAPFGGWATINADPLPDNVVPGRKVQLTFLVKQHGVTPLAGLKPT